MKKGFTLIELVGVVIIIALICLLAVPSFLGRIRNTEKEISGAMNEILKSASTIYLDNNNYPKTDGDVYCITISDLVERELLNSPVKDPVTKDEIEEDSYVKVSVNGVMYNYEFTNHCEEVINLVLSGTSINEYAEKLVYTDGVCDTDNKAYEYMGGCYLKASRSTELQNHVWYNGFLWRIMGINSDGSIRMITEENVTTIPYNVDYNSNFTNSHADNWLNTYFYEKLSDENNLKTDIIVEGTFCQGASTSDLETMRNDCTGGKTLTRNVGLLSVDEYNLAGGLNSYLTIDQMYWTMSPSGNSTALYVDRSGVKTSSVMQLYGLKPVVNVKPNTIITSGSGTLGDYYVLGENKADTNITGELANAKVGEYISLNDRTYRVVETGVSTKLILDKSYQINNAYYLMTYGDDNVFSTSAGVGLMLNTTILDSITAGTNQDKLKSSIIIDKWYQNKFELGYSYTVSLDENSVPIEAQVGLIRIGEMLSSQSYSILTRQGTTLSAYSNAVDYWTLTPYTTSTYAWFISNRGNAGTYRNSSASETSALRPVINLDNTKVTITSGNGAPNTPYIVTVK